MTKTSIPNYRFVMPKCATCLCVSLTVGTQGPMRNKCVPNSYSIHIGVTTGKGGKIQPTIQQTNTSKD